MLILAAVCIIAIAGADQLIKAWITQNMALYEERPFLSIGGLDILHLKFIENTGSAFSSFAGQTALLIGITVVSMAACAFILVRYARNKPLLFWPLTMILGGGIGNLLDRLFRGGRVVDYLDVQLFKFAVFNFADCFVTVGTVLLFVYILFFMEEKKPEAPASEEESHDEA